MITYEQIKAKTPSPEPMDVEEEVMAPASQAERDSAMDDDGLEAALLMGSDEGH